MVETRTGKSVGFDFSFKKFCIEDLNIKGMQRLYGKKIGDLSFSEFVNILQAVKFVTVAEQNRIETVTPQ